MKANVATFFVPGRPKGKGRPRFGWGRVHTPADTRQYEGKVSTLALRATGGRSPMRGAVKLTLVALFALPKKSSKGFPWRPDLDNIVKIICDAMNGLIYKDDAQVVCVSALKRFAADGEGVGVTVTVEEVT